MRNSARLCTLKGQLNIERPKPLQQRIGMVEKSVKHGKPVMGLLDRHIGKPVCPARETRGGLYVYMLESWITFLLIAVPLVLVGASERLATWQKTVVGFGIVFIFLFWYLSGTPGGASYLLEACPNCDLW